MKEDCVWEHPRKGETNRLFSGVLEGNIKVDRNPIFCVQRRTDFLRT